MDKEITFNMIEDLKNSLRENAKEFGKRPSMEVDSVDIYLNNLGLSIYTLIDIIKEILEEDEEKEKPKTSFNLDRFLERLQDSFFHQLSAKTGWGKNQVQELFKEVLKDLLQDTEGL